MVSKIDIAYKRKFHGQEKLKVNDNFYNCIFKHGLKNSYGTGILKDGSIFKETWKDDMHEGQSLTILKSIWTNDQPYHYEVRANNGNLYIEELDPELRLHGYDILKYPSGDISSGGFNHGIL